MIYYWDPLTGNLSDTEVAEIQSKSEKVRAEYEKVKQDPQRLQRKLKTVSAVSLGLAAFIAIVLIVLVSFGLIGFNAVFLIPTITFFLLVVPAAFIFGKTRDMQRDLTNIMIASRFGLLYDPEDNKERWSALALVYPEIFKLGNSGQYVTNQLWGTIEDTKKQNFWLSGFAYTVGSGDSAHTFNNLVYAFELPIKTIVDFSLSPRPFNINLGSFFSDQRMTTESNEFNRKFRIELRGDIGSEGTNVLRILAPDVQEHLISFSKKHGGLWILFREKTVFVEFADQITLNHTNLVKNPDLDPRDEAEILQNINEAYLLAKEIFSCFEYMPKAPQGSPNI